MTVRFALPVPDVDPPVTFASTAYVAGVAVGGTDLVIVADPLELGAIVNVDCEKLVVQPGSSELRSKALLEQAAESLLVTDTV